MSAFLLLGVWLLAQSLFSCAQTTNATCEVSHQWAFNSQNQSPCAVASSLIAVCTGSYNLPALPENTHYGGPDMQDANPCQCNTVVYSLLSECGLCQGRSATMWSVFEENCNEVSVGSFLLPLPSGLHVPGWAYFDVEASDMFNESLALANANITESTAIPQPSKTSSSVPASTSSPSSSSAAVPAQTTAVTASSNISVASQKQGNAIGGGLVGGFAAGILLSALAYWIYRRRQKARANGAILNSPMSYPSMTEYRTDTLPTGSNPAIPVPSITVSSLNSQSGLGSLQSVV